MNGRAIQAKVGETLLQAALRNNMVLPQECCTGQCGTCRVSVTSGSVDDVNTRINNTVLGCCALLEGDATITYDEVPTHVKRTGKVIAINPISPEIYEIQIKLTQILNYLPGQYVNLTFNGFPGRDYSPTIFEDGTQDPLTLVFQIKRYEKGLVSSAIDSTIRIGHKLQLKGPFGQAFYRQGKGRLVLIASGTGWAPMWSIAQAAKQAEPMREIHIIIGARNAANLYMGNSLLWLAKHGVQNITICASGEGFGGLIQKGRPTDFIPELHSGDIIHAAGTPAMVKAVEILASNKGITLYADPFTASSNGLSMMNRLQKVIRGAKFNPLSPKIENAIYTNDQRKTSITLTKNLILPKVETQRKDEKLRISR